MACIGNMPSFKYVTVESLVITYNNIPYPIKTFVTNKKYIVWNIDRPYQLEDTNVRPNASLLEYLVVINDNGKPTIIEHEELLYSFNQTTNGSNLTSSSEYNALKSKVDKNTTKFNLISNTVDDMTQIIGSTEELEDGSIIYNLNKVKSDSKSYGISIGEIQTKVDDKYAEIKPIILNDLVEYLRSVSEYKLSFTNILEDTLITDEELTLINTSKTNIVEKSTKLQTTLSNLKVIVDGINDTEKSQLVTDMKTKLSTLQNALITICDSYLQDSKISGEEKTNIIQKTYELATYIGTVQNTCSNITVNGQAGVIYSVENEVLMLKDKTTSSINELNRSNNSLTEKYSKLEQTSGELSGKVSEIKTSVENKSNQDKQNIRCNDLGAKINYSAFDTPDNGEIYLHGYDSNNNPTDTNGILYWNGTELHITKGIINPNGDFGTNDCYLCTDLNGGTFVAYYSGGWKYKWLIGSNASGDLNIGDNYIAFGQFKMNDDESFQYAYLYSSPIKLENVIGMSSIETRVKSAESKLTTEGLTTIIGNHYTTTNDVDGIVTNKGYQTSSQVQQTVDSLEARFKNSGGYNLVYNGDFRRKSSLWSATSDSAVVYYTSGLSSPDCSGVLIVSDYSITQFISQTVDINTGYQRLCFSYYQYVSSVGNDGSTNSFRRGEVQLTYTDGSYSWHNCEDVSVFDQWQRKSINIIPEKSVSKATIYLYNRDTTRQVYYSQIMLEVGDLSTGWSPNPNELYDGIITMDRDGLTVEMVDGAASKGSSRMTHQGIATYDEWGNTKSWFSDDTAYIRELNVDIINNQYILQYRPRPTNWYVGQYATGDGSGRDYNNKSSNINSVFEYIKRNHGCFCNGQDINIYCDDWMNTSEHIYIGGWIGSGNINVYFGTNTTFTGSISIEECTMQVLLDGQSSGWDYNDGCMWYRQNGNPNPEGAPLSVRRSSVVCRGFRSHNGATFYGYPFVYAYNGAIVALYNNDLVKYYEICRTSVGSTIYINSTRGDVGMISDISESSSIIARAYLPVFNVGQIINNSWGSTSTIDGAAGFNSLWYPKYIPTPEVPSPTPQPDPPSQSWHWSEKTFYFKLSSTTEGSGITTSGWSDKWGQGKWGSYKSHRGHAIPSESISAWTSGARNISMTLTMTRLSTSHGNYGATPVPKIKQKDGSYWDCGVAFALGNKKNITLSNGIVSGLSDGTLSELTMWAGSSSSDYSMYNEVSLKVTCEKYY